MADADTIKEVTKFEYKGELFNTLQEAERAKYVDAIYKYVSNVCVDLAAWQVEEVIKALLYKYDIVEKSE